ncbi:nascent polypeptide-associated complex protein [Halonotius aquaticus]|uniref:Nascent polypeptide-associated complex protein n=1 Tax=Halonotius aquaticus TaxID=2216978 RepID=A0A3A6QA64_9EURY|nr:nascent polypeptide-associated complex protein [Halonotius aquaticus]RJX43908.1 nascent polypeptide-associated complex protein [Halonotius aquaticus]
MFGGGGMNPRKMQQMMEQMGIDVTEIDAESVTITTNDGEQLVFEAPEITRMDAQGTQTYQIVGEPDRQEASGAAGAVESGNAGSDAGDDSGGEADDEIPESDIKLVASQTGVSPSEAREALEAEDGEPAAAISRLE